MTNLVALGGRALFDVNDVAYDTEAAPSERGPYYAWMLFIYKVNSMVAEVFATKGKDITLEPDTPAPGWMTERYKRARVMHPPVDSGSKILIQADDVRLYSIWDQAMQQVVKGNIHRH